jgi:hypothetical protein
MAVAKYSDASTESSNIAGTALNSLANGGLSAILADVDNTGSSGKNINIRFWIKLGSLTPATGGSIAVRLVCKRGSTYADRTATIFTGEQQTVQLTTSTSAKEATTCAMRLPGPFVFGVEIVNNSGVALASSGNEVYYTVWNEEAI